jgi:hypothetical protein
MLRLIIAATPCLLMCIGGIAQQLRSESLPDAPSQTQEPPPMPQTTTPQSGVEILKLEQKSFVFPDLATSGRQLSSWQKFKLSANDSVAVSTIGAAAIAAAYGQGINSPSGYHQGAEGYGKRFGANMARAASENMFGTFLLASALHQDPQFYVIKNLSFAKSLEYAGVRLFITRSDSGEREVNYSGLIGPLMGEGLANAYYPDENRTVGSTFIRYASDLAWKFGGNLLRQYWPTFNRRLRLIPESSPTSGTTVNIP